MQERPVLLAWCSGSEWAFALSSLLRRRLALARWVTYEVSCIEEVVLAESLL